MACTAKDVAGVSPVIEIVVLEEVPEKLPVVVTALYANAVAPPEPGVTTTVNVPPDE